MTTKDSINVNIDGILILYHFTNHRIPITPIHSPFTHLMYPYKDH